MDENKVIRPMDFVRLTNIDESNVIKDTKNHIGLVKEVSGFITSWLSFGNRKAIIGAAEMRKCLDKIFDLAIDERLK